MRQSMRMNSECWRVEVRFQFRIKHISLSIRLIGRKGILFVLGKWRIETLENQWKVKARVDCGLEFHANEARLKGDITDKRLGLLRSMLPFCCLFVCLSVAFVHCAQTAKDIDTTSLAHVWLEMVQWSCVCFCLTLPRGGNPLEFLDET